MNIPRKIILSILFLTIGAPHAGMAAPDKPPPPAARTLPFAGFKLSPSLSIKTVYDDNIYTEARRPQGDLATHIAPSLRLERGDRDKSVVFKAGAEQVLYAGDSDDNYLDYNASINAKYRFDKATQWIGFADLRRKHARRGDNFANPDSDAAEPIPYDVMRANSRIIHSIGAWQFRPYAGVTRYEYHNVERIDGTLINQDARDRTEYKLGGQIRYALQKGLKLVFEGHLMPRHYDDGGNAARSSDAATYLAGFHFQPSKSWWIETMGGYMTRDYDKTIYDDIDTYAWRAGLNWRYRDGALARLRLNRSIAEVTENGAGGAIRTDLRADISHPFTPALTGKMGARYKLIDYQGGNGADNGTDDRRDHYHQISAGLTYSLNDAITLDADYAFTALNSNKDSADYQSNSLTTGLNIRF